jgi:glucose/arabinose dehydrogenase
MTMRSKAPARVSALVVAALLLSVALPANVAAAAPSLKTAVVQQGLVHPWDVDFARDGKMFVTERPGRIRIYSHGNSGGVLLQTYAIPGVRAEGEAGAMGIALDINFDNPGQPGYRKFYVCVSRQFEGQWRNQVLRYRMGTGQTINPDGYIIKYGMRANTIHNGCAVEMRADHTLWISMGDSANAALAQDRNSLNGKILRVNRDGTVPSNNPVIAGKRDIVYSLGHRNPQGIAFQVNTGYVYAIEHGPERDDEINWILPGRNYGWPCFTDAGRPYQTSGCGAPSNYTHSRWSSGSPTIATSNGVFVTGSNWRDFRNNLFVATLKEQDVRRFTVSGTAITTQVQTLFNGTWGRLRAAVEGPSSRLYLTTSNGSNDKIIRIIAS